MINLLPPEQKKFLVQDQKKRLVAVLGIVGLVFFLSLILVLLSIQFYLQGQIEAQRIILEQKQEEFQRSEIKTLQEEIELANQSFSKLKSFYQERISLVDILERIYHTLPPGVYLRSFSWKGREVALVGFAPTRSALLEFRKGLIEEKEFQDISFPGEPWIQAADINFDVTFRIEKEGTED